MKIKHLLWILSALVAVVAMAAGVAVFVNKYLNKKTTNYIECECEDDEDEFAQEVE